MEEDENAKTQERDRSPVRIGEKTKSGNQHCTPTSRKFSITRTLHPGNFQLRARRTQGIVRLKPYRHRDKTAETIFDTQEAKRADGEIQGKECEKIANAT